MWVFITFKDITATYNDIASAEVSLLAQTISCPRCGLFPLVDDSSHLTHCCGNIILCQEWLLLPAVNNVVAYTANHNYRRLCVTGVSKLTARPRVPLTVRCVILVVYTQTHTTVEDVTTIAQPESLSCSLFLFSTTA